MSKGNEGAEKTGKIEKVEKTKETHVTDKKPVKGHTPMPDGCHSWGCKSQAKKFNFCIEHYDHFKFGLIKKTGEPVSDYEKKLGHYQAYLAKLKVNKVA